MELWKSFLLLVGLNFDKPQETTFFMKLHCSFIMRIHLNLCKNKLRNNFKLNISLKILIKRPKLIVSYVFLISLANLNNKTALNSVFFFTRRLERNHSEQTVGPPPGYEEAVSDSQSHSQEERYGSQPNGILLGPYLIVSDFLFNERDGGLGLTVPSPKASSPSGNTSEGQATTMADIASSASNKENDFDEFDPHASRSGTEATLFFSLGY